VEDTELDEPEGLASCEDLKGETESEIHDEAVDSSTRSRREAEEATDDMLKEEAGHEEAIGNQPSDNDTDEDLEENLKKRNDKGNMKQLDLILINLMKMKI
jgi:hypothetical protein